MFKSAQRFKEFVGGKVMGLVTANFLLGVLWFFVELSFLFVIQGFLLAIGFLDSPKAKFPDWYPTDLTSSLLILMVYGLLRTTVNGLKNMVPVLVSEVFAVEQRRKIIRLSFFSDHKKSTSDILSAFGELTTKSGTFLQHSSNVLGLSVAVLLLVGLSFRLAPIEALMGYGALAAIMLPFRRLNRKVGVFGERLVDEWRQVNKVLVEGLRNLFLLRVYRLLGVEYTKGDHALQSYEKQYTQYMSVATLISGFPLFAGMAIVAGVTLISKNYLQTDPAHYVAFLYIFLRAATNASFLSISLSEVLFYRGVFRSLQSLFGDSGAMPLQQSRVGESSTETLPPVSVQFKEVDFAYLEGQPIVRQLSLDLKPGQFLLVKGPSGAGKSTIIKLMVGLLKPEKGEVKVDNMQPSDFIEERATSIGYVGPEPYMVHGTVRENLLYGLGISRTDKEIWQCLESVSMVEPIQAQAKGLDELLNEETQLSTGQKQRLALARALLRRPRLLILDEATANIDMATEKLIVQYLQNIKSQVTVVAISHRDSFDTLADLKIVVGESRL